MEHGRPFWLAPASGSWGFTNGEIDIYETVNGQNTGIHSSMHSPPNCQMSASVSGKSTMDETNCNAGTPLPYNGCGVTHTDNRSSKSGTFAMIWTADLDNGEGAIVMYWWAHDDPQRLQSFRCLRRERRARSQYVGKREVRGLQNEPYLLYVESLLFDKFDYQYSNLRGVGGRHLQPWRPIGF